MKVSLFCVGVSLFMLLHSVSIFGQTFPLPNDTLNYTSVCFSFPWNNNATHYTLVVVDQSVPNDSMYYLSEGNKKVINNFQPGHTYWWKIVAQKQKQPISTSEGSRFYISKSENTVRYQLVVNDTVQRTNNLLLMDYAHMAIDRNARVVWHLPNIPSNVSLRDLKITDDGTMTAILVSNAIEMNLHGDILWNAPENKENVSNEDGNYHHSLTKLHNGNYLVLGNDMRTYLAPNGKDSVKVNMGTVIEYAPNGDVVWIWKARDFIKQEWIPFELKNDGTYKAIIHLNAAAVEGDYVYAGFRDLGWILKIKKDSKEVVAIFGGNDSKQANHYAKHMFSYQHDAFMLNDGSIGIINNDSVSVPGVVSSVIVFSQAKENTGEKLFEFPFNYDGRTPGKSLKLGNLQEMPNGNLLVNMGAINQVFEVTRDKKVVWSAWVEKYDDFKKRWHFFSQYRVSAASSLYPNEFCVKLVGFKSQKNRWEGSAYILNIGSETNAYNFWVENKGKLVQIGESKKVLPDGSITHKFIIPKNIFPILPKVLIVKVAGKSYKQQVELVQATQ